MKVTGPERDLANTTSAADDLDYMHARFHNPLSGRLLSFDMGPALLKQPQTWNRDAYVIGNPMKYVDPTGEVVDLSKLSDDEREKLLQSLNDITGNTYGANDQGHLTVIAYGDSSSETATAFVDDLIGTDDIFTAHARNNSPDVLFGQNPAGTKDILLDFSDFEALAYGKVDERAYSIATTFLHETAHAARGLKDPPTGSRFSELGEAEAFVNQMRRERGLPTRGPIYGTVSAGLFGQRQGINFQNVNSGQPERVFYVYFPTKLARP